MPFKALHYVQSLYSRSHISEGITITALIIPFLAWFSSFISTLTRFVFRFFCDPFISQNFLGLFLCSVSSSFLYIS